MNKTPYYEMPVYEPNDSPSLLDGYNKAVIKTDETLHRLQNDIDLLKLEIKTLKKGGN